MTTQLSPRALFLGIFLLLTSLTATSSEQLLAPQHVIEKTSLALLKQLKDPEFANDKVAIRQFVDHTIFPSVDMVRMSALTLGKHWKKASKDQKKRFIAAFKTLLVNTYSTTFTEQFSNWTIKYLPFSLKPSDKKSTVKTTVSQEGQSSAKIDYSMVLRHEQWKIYDIKIEGISLVINNRETFSQRIKHSGSLDAVITELEAKNQR